MLWSTATALTECSTAIAVAVGAELEEFPGTLGRPIITVSMEIRDPFGEWLPDGIEGEVCVRSPFVMLGYWENDEATESAIAPPDAGSAPAISASSKTGVSVSPVAVPT